MTHIIDYQATQPINKTGETTFVIPHSPNKAILANIKLKISRKDSRDNTEIFNAQVGIESTDSEQFYAQTFQAIDQNVSCGTHEYSLTVENLTSGASADIVGPLSFSGLAIGQDHKCC